MQDQDNVMNDVEPAENQQNQVVSQRVTRSQRLQQENASGSQQQPDGQQLALHQNNIQYVVNQQNDFSTTFSAINEIHGSVKEQIGYLISQLVLKFTADEQARSQLQTQITRIEGKMSDWVPELDNMVAQISNAQSDVEQHVQSVQSVRERVQQLEDNMRHVTARVTSVKEKQAELEKQYTDYVGEFKLCKVASDRVCQSFSKQQKQAQAGNTTLHNRVQQLDEKITRCVEEQAGLRVLENRIIDVESRLTVLRVCNPPTIEATAPAPEAGPSTPVHNPGAASDADGELSDDEPPPEEASRQLPPPTTQPAPPTAPAHTTPPNLTQPFVVPTSDAEGWQTQRTRRRRPMQPPLDPFWCLYVATHRLRNGKWTFRSAADDWRAILTALLGTRAHLLHNVRKMEQATDTRLCLAAPTDKARADLIAALRAIPSLRCFPMLSAQERANRAAAFDFARTMGVRVVDKGDKCGLCGKREATPLNLRVVHYGVHPQYFQSSLQDLLEQADRRASLQHPPQQQPRKPQHQNRRAPPRAARAKQPHYSPGRPQRRPQRPALHRLPPQNRSSRGRRSNPPRTTPPHAWSTPPPAIYTPPTQLGGTWRQLPHAMAAAHPGAYGYWQPHILT